MKYISLIFLAQIMLLTTGCTTHQVEPEMSMKAPMYVDQTAKHITCNWANKKLTYEGSIYSKGINTLFSDKKAMNVNDIVTIEIDEKTFQSSQGNKKISESSVNNLGGGVFNGGANGGISAAIAKSLNNATQVGFKTNSNTNFTGTGTQSRNEKFTTTISARVVKILNNGNYFISGSRELLLNGTKQIIQISGVIRPYDIDRLNTVNSKYIADAKIHYETQGDIKEATRRPWGSRLVNSVWPF
jgi:flagellar L-ring protein precursor FlgH